MNNTEATFNTENLIKSINNILQEELQKIFVSFLEKYKKYEETYIAVMNLPCVNTKPQLCEMQTSSSNIEITINNRLKSLEDRIYKLVEKVETYSVAVDDVKNQLSKMKMVSKEVVDLTVPHIKLEKENIHLEIEDPKEEISDDESSEDEDEESVTTEKAIEAEVVAVGSKNDEEAEEADDETENKEEDDEEEADDETESKEEEVDEEESVETETKEEEDDEEEEELFEIEIDDITYCTNDENNGYIYEYKNEEVGDKIGYFKEGEPFFYADEK